MRLTGIRLDSNYQETFADCSEDDKQYLCINGNHAFVSRVAWTDKCDWSMQENAGDRCYYVQPGGRCGALPIDELSEIYLLEINHETARLS